MWHCGIVKHGASPPSPSILFLPVKQGSPGRFPEEKCLQNFDLVFNKCKKVILVKAQQAIACTQLWVGLEKCSSAVEVMPRDMPGPEEEVAGGIAETEGEL